MKFLYAKLGKQITTGLGKTQMVRRQPRTLKFTSVFPVPDGEKFVKNRRPCPAPKPEPVPKAVSPGRFKNLPEELKAFLTNEHRLDSLLKLLHPHAVALFRDLSGMKAEKIEAIGLLDSENATDGEVPSKYLTKLFIFPFSDRAGDCAEIPRFKSTDLYESGDKATD